MARHRVNYQVRPYIFMEGKFSMMKLTVRLEGRVGEVPVVGAQVGGGGAVPTRGG